MHHAASAYAQRAQTGETPRETEATVLMRAAARLQAISESWDEKAGELDDALSYNRRLWTLLVTAVTSEDNPLPLAIKQNIVSLASFIFKRTIDCSIEPTREKLGPLISINREIAMGLRMRPVAP